MTRNNNAAILGLTIFFPYQSLPGASPRAGIPRPFGAYRSAYEELCGILVDEAVGDGAELGDLFAGGAAEFFLGVGDVELEEGFYE